MKVGSTGNSDDVLCEKQCSKKIDQNKKRFGESVFLVEISSEAEALILY